MMNKIVAVAVTALLLSAGGVEAKTKAITNPVTDAQKAEFYKVCMGIADNNTLCTCKADAAVKLIDTDFMAVVIASMKGAAPPDNLFTQYDDYIARSNKICKPEYM